MGKSLVDQIPTNSDDYQEWLKAQRAHWAKWDDLLQKILEIGPEDLAELRLPRAEIDTENIWHEAFDERLKSIPPSFHIGTYNFSIEWSYTIDLDREVFSVDNGAHFRLDRVSQNGRWIKALALDADSERLALPQAVGEETITSLTVDTEDFAPNAAEYWKILKPRVVTPDLAHIESTQPTVNRLRSICFDLFQATQKRSLSVTLLGWQAHEMPFREIAYSILCLAAGGEHLTLVDDKRIFLRAGCAGMLTASDTEEEMELVSSLGAGYHRKGMPTGCAPDNTRYWFEGALVSLVPRLDRPGILKKAVADVVQYGQIQCGRIAFNAVLISIEYLVLVKSFPSGMVHHTKLLPLIPIALHLSLDARERYGSHYIDDLYRAEVEKTDKQNESDNEETSSEKHNTHNDTGAQMSAENSSSDKAIDRKNKEAVDEIVVVEKERMGNSGDPGGEGKDPDCEKNDKDTIIQENEDEANNNPSEWTIYETFTSLIAFFEASVRESLKPTNVDGKGIPTEIYETILSHVSDMQTYNACLKVSRRVRSLCLRRPLIMDNVVLLELQSGGDKEQSTFTAVEVSANKQMEITLSWHSYRNRPHYETACYVIAGSERDRRTFIDQEMTFEGLNVPSKWDSVEHTTENQYSRRASLPQSTDKRWNFSLQSFPIAKESSSRDLGQFWTYVLQKFKIEHSNACQQDWELPPNTKCFLGTYVDWSENYLGSFHYLAVRLKRASKFRNSLWGDIASEVADSLESLDNTSVAIFPEPKLVQSVGVDHPFVLLAVGPEVRLYRWLPLLDGDQVMEGAEKQTTTASRLMELQPGKIFSPVEEEGRKAITEFLEMAIKHRDERVQKYEDEKVRESE